IYQNPGTYTVSLEVTSDKGCTTSITQDIVISEDPVADFSFSQTCFGEDMSFTDLSSSSNSWYWVFNNGTASNEENPGGVSYSHAGTFDVSLTVTSPEGCENTVTKPVEVLPMPVAQFSVDPICVDNPIEFEDESFVQNDVIVDWSWDMGNGFVSSEQNPTTTYSTTDPVDVSLTVSTATCSNTLAKTVTPHPLPVVTPVYEQGCTPLSVTPNIPVESNVLYQWDFGDGTSSTAKNPTHIYTNSTSAIAEYTLALRARSSYGCRDSVFSEIRVYPESRADYSVSDRKICSGEEIVFTNESQNAVQYQWDFGDGTQSVAQNPSHVFENTTGTAVFYPVTLTVWSSQSCIDSVTQFITVYPDPVFPVTLNTDAACHPATINFETESGGQTYYWDFGDGTSTNGSNSMHHTFQNPGLTDEQFEVNVIVTDNFGCIAETTETITVFASPIADFSVPYSHMCAPELLSIENNSYNVADYQWDFGDGNTSAEASAIVEHTYENLTENTQTYNLQLAVVSPSGCLDTLEQEIDVYPNIHADFTPNPVSGCSPLLVSFTNQSVGAHGHYWDFGDNMFSTQAHPNHVYSHTNFTPTDFEIEYVAVSTYGCSDTVRKSVTVKPLTQADFTPSHTTVCSEDEISFQNNSINGYDYLWDFGDGSTSVAENPTHTYVNTQENAALYTVKLIVTSIDGCTDTLERLITVYPIPEISVTLDKSASCSPAEITLTTESGAQSYFWDFGDGETTYASSSIRHTYINQDVVDKEYTASVLVRTKEGCEATAEEQLTVYASPIADFSTSSTTLCAPMELSITNNTFNAETYYWNFGDGDVSYSANPTLSHIYENASDDEKQFDLQLTAESSNGCVDVAYENIVVYPTLDVSIESTELTGCSPLRVDFTNNSIGVDKHTWSFGDGKTSYDEAPAHVYFNDLFVPQEYTGKYSASSVFGCVDSTEFTIMVSPQTQASFTASDTEICNGETVEFTNTSVNGQEYTWLLPDGEIAHDEHLNYTFINETNTTVYEPIQLIVESEYGCVDSVVQIITIYPQPHGEIIPDTNQGCDPLQVTFNAPAGGMKYMWDLGDGVRINGSDNLTHTFVNQTIEDKTYPVELTITSNNGCVQTMNQEVTVFTSPKASFSMDTNIGCSPVTIHFENTTEDAVSYTWDFGDGDVREISDMQFDKTYSNTSAMEASHSITVTAVSENGCEHVADNSLSVFPEIQAHFTPDYEGNCTPLEVFFNNQTIGAYSYSWHFGDGNYSSNFNTKHVYLNNTQETINHTVFLVAKSPYNCIDTSEHVQIPVHPKPFANFDADIITECSPFETHIENQTEGATKYLWYVDEDLYNQGEHPEPFRFSNTSDTITNHMLKLSAINEFNCIDTSLQPIAVFPEVEAQFDSDNSGCSPFTVSFENLSENSSSYMWDFGNQKMSSVENPTTTFINDSTDIKEFTVTLTTTSTVGCHSSTTQDIIVYPSPKPNFMTSASYLRMPESTIGVENLTEGEWRYLWSFGDGAKSDEEQPAVHTYNSPGEYKVILKAYSPYCEDTSSHFIVIGGAQVYADYDSTFSGCVPLTVSFTNKSRNAEWYSWDFGDGSSHSSEENPTYTYTEPGTYIVELTAGNDEVQDVSRTHTVSVYENPVAEFEVAPEIAYLPNAVISTYNKSINGYDYTWYFGDGTSSDEFQASHEYFEEGLYDVALAVTSREGCYDSLMIEDAVQVLLKCKLLFPNVFTPVDVESDGYYNPEEPELTNNIFHPVSQNIIDYKLQIFNRWGEMVFESHELERGWNGFYKGKLSKSDVYIWRAQASCWGGKKINLKGNVTLLR
ncbi:MAG: PKD domain-containing protein, partial [Bacteroidales bacterium]